MKLKILPLDAHGNKSQQLWYFIDGGRKNKMAFHRWVIVRKYCADGSVWWGVRANWYDTHEDAILDGVVEQEMSIALQAIELLKKDWQKYLQYDA